ncbi:MAG: translation initiation factor IF-2 [Planctomycetes bacterium]|nr:translation initiation factor IF-2 [Planctomycetota bacterium]
MPVRIYALAKELDIDSKALVDMCNQAGVADKGSALASLTDDEVATVKAFVSNRGKPAPPSVASAAAEAAPVMPTQQPPSAAAGRITVLPTRKSAEPPPVAPAEPPPVAPAEPPPVAPAETPPVASGPKAAPLPEAAPAKEAAAKPPTPGESPPAMPETVRREDYIPPAGAAGDKPRLIDAMRSRSAGRSRKPSGSGGTRTPASPRFAAVPAAKKAPAEGKKNDGPAPQKPDLKLPADAIRASKGGAGPLAEHLRKAEKRRTADQANAAGATGATPAARTDGRGGRQGVRRGEKKEMVGGPGSLGGRAQRQARRKRHDGRGRSADDSRGRRSRARFKRTGTNTAKERKDLVTLEIPCSVRNFSEAIGVPVQQVLRSLLSLGTGGMPSINSNLELDTAELLAEELGVEIRLRQQVTIEDKLLAEIDELVDDADSLQPRPPVVTFLGHVDHGKTSLLDRIIGIDVVSGESGGITQHIRAYQIEKEGRRISFVDTPGHEAFTEMRARGANVTDIAVLVVAADDGVMPQTEEAISHARAAEVPIVVALNKMDLPGADPEKVLSQLAAVELLPVEWGGDVEVVKTSAETGDGIDDLLETLLTIAELHDYKANPDRPAYGTCLEAQREGGRGIVAKFIVEKGTLRVGDCLVCGTTTGRVKAMYETLQVDRKLLEAGPAVPVNVTGLDEAPEAGEHFYVLDDIAKAREIASARAIQVRRSTLGSELPHITLENLFARLSHSREVQTLNLVLRSDVRGSIEAIQNELSKLDHPEVKIKVLQATVGGITEADIHLADASDAIVVGFNVVPDEAARVLADQRGVQIRRYSIIYKLSEDLRAALEGMLKPEKREAELGRALVQRTFTISRVGTVAGCRVMSGNMHRNARVRVIRNSTIIGDYPLDTLRREKDDAREVREGLECGVKLAGFNDLKEGDILEAYKIEEVARTL